MRPGPHRERHGRADPLPPRARINDSGFPDRQQISDVAETRIEADQEHPFAADTVGKASPGQQEYREGQGVGVEHPLQVSEAGVSRSAHAGQAMPVSSRQDARERRDVDDGQVEHQHEGGRGDHAQGPPAGPR